MKDTVKDYYYPWWGQLIVSAGLGTVNTTVFHTPLCAIMNESLNKKINKSQPDFKITPFLKIRFLNGLGPHISATMITMSGSLAVTNYICNKLRVNGYEIDNVHKCFVSVFAGAVSGGFASPVEAIAQVQQRQSSTPPPTTLEVAKNIYRNNGFFAFGRGSAATMVRSAGFFSGCLELMPYVVEALLKITDNSVLAYLLAGTICGVTLGTATAPFNILQFTRKNLIDVAKSNPPTYREIVNSAVKETNSSAAALMRLCGGLGALGLRTFNLTARFTLFYTGNKLIKEVMNNTNENQLNR
jgi:hypothetical protein